MRTIITGDIHGCSKQLEALMDKVNLNISADRLIILGDLFDRGPDSYGVLKLVQNYKKKMKNRFVLLMGNHEDLMLNSDDDPYTWKINGSGKTIRSFKENRDDVHRYFSWFSKLPLWYKDDAFLCVHGGVDPYADDPEDMDPETLIWDRRCTSQGIYTGPLVIAGHTPLKAPVLWQNKVMTELEYDRQYDLPERGFMCIDTGCVYNGILTGLVIMDGKMMLRGIEGYDKNKED